MNKQQPDDESAIGCRLMEAELAQYRKHLEQVVSQARNHRRQG